MRPKAFVMMPHCWSTNRNFLIFTQSNDTRVNLSSFDSTKAIFTMCKKHQFLKGKPSLSNPLVLPCSKQRVWKLGSRLISSIKAGQPTIRWRKQARLTSDQLSQSDTQTNRHPDKQRNRQTERETDNRTEKLTNRRLSCVRNRMSDYKWPQYAASTK